MKKVVILAPDFSPSSYPPALRARFFAQNLPAFGWEPIVIATDPKYYETSIDRENDKLLPEELVVLRTKALPARFTRPFGLGDLGWRSLWHHWCALKKVIRQQKPDLLFLPTPPSAGLLLGRLAHARFGIPYVVDLIDPIATDYYWKLPRAQRPPKWLLAYRLGRFVEKTVMRRVSHITAVDASYADEALRRCRWLQNSDVTGIPYGGDLGDFEYVRRNPRLTQSFDPSDGFFHACYTGRGGADLEPALRALFAGFRLGLERTPEVFGRVRMHFVGTSYSHHPEPTILPLAEAAGLREFVTEHPSRVPYLDALQLAISADALIALGSEGAHYTASKIFPYLMANRPLIAIFHEASSVVSILRELQAAEPVTFSSAADLRNRTEQTFDAWQNAVLSSHSSSLEVRRQRFAPYSTRAMAARLAAVFEIVTAPPKWALVSTGQLSVTR